MRLFSSSLKQRLLLISLLPGLLAAGILTLGISWLYSSQLTTTTREQYFSISAYLLRAAAPLIAQTADPRQGLTDLGSRGLDLPGVRSITFYDTNQKPLAHVGPSAYPVTHMSWPPAMAAEADTHGSHHFFGMIQDPVTAAPRGWLDIEFTHNELTTIFDRTLILLFLALLIAGFISTLVVSLLLRRSTDALTHLVDGLRMIQTGKKTSPLPLTDTDEINQLIRALNETIENLRAQLLDMQEHVNQSTQDLRETLETIEIQNIELDLARKEALQASRVKSEFLANTSHEIRTPLNGIIGFTRMLLKQSTDAQQREYLQTIQQSSETLLNIINDILDLSKIEAGKLVLDYTSFNMYNLLEETLQILAPAAHEKGLELVHLIQADVPEHCFGDALRLRQILTNLIGNAIKFSTTGSIAVRISLENHQGASALIKFSVTDSGIGIHRSFLNDGLFTAFSQANSRLDQRDSTGLGLAISKKLVGQMGGDISIDSKENVGSTFWFTLNLDIDVQTRAIVPVIPDTQRHVLLFDSNAISRQAISTLLTQWGIRVALTDSYNDILPALSSNSQQPRENWFGSAIISLAPDNPAFPLEHLGELVSNIRQYCPCIVCTPTTLKHFLNKSLPPGIAVITKPVLREKLLFALQASISPAATIEHSAAYAASSLAPATILVVDDNPANLKLLCSLLRDMGHTILEASNGLEALSLCQQQAFDLILMDIRMPGMDGIEATKRIRTLNNRNRSTPVIAVTAQASADQKQHLLLAGLDDYLSKPIHENQLDRMLNKWLANPVRNDDAGIDNHAIDKCVSTELCLKLSNGKPELAADMLNMLLAELAQNQHDINRALQDGQVEDAIDLVHQLHGASCYCGVPQLQSSCKQLEQLLKTRPNTSWQKELTSLNQAIDTLIRWKERYDVSALFDI